MELFIGVDVGTSLIKAAIYDLHGKKLVGVSSKVPVLYPHEGYAEQDMDEVWHGVAGCLKELTMEYPELISDIKAISCAGQGDGLWAVNKNDKPIRNAILWCDNRASANVEKWVNDGVPEKFFINSGITLWPGCAAAILDWLRENEPANYKAIDTYFCCKDWINLNLTGRRATDISDGTIPFMDVNRSKISLEQIRMVGLDDEIFDKAPEVLQSYEVIGTLTENSSKATGLPEGLPVVTGMIDVSANAIAAGAIHSGQTFAIIGTTLLNAVLLDDPIVKPANIGFMVTSPLPNQWTRVLGSLSGTPNYDWLLREVFGSESYTDITELYEEVDAQIENIPPGSNKVLFLPFIHGERSPFVNPHATACFLGIRENTSRADLVKAVFEGVALATKHNLVSVGQPIDEIVVTGGGSVNTGWCRIFADVTGARIRVPGRREFGTLGAAIMAAKGMGAIDDFAFDTAGSDEDLIYEPDKDNRDFYDGLYELYVSTIEQMESYWRQRNELFK